MTQHYWSCRSIFSEVDRSGHYFPLVSFATTRHLYRYYIGNVKRGPTSEKVGLRTATMIKTFDDAYRFVIQQRICTVFGSQCSPYPSLWDNTKLSDKKPAAGGWSPRVLAVWDWKTRIPQTYPDQVFYGKLRSGDAALIEMEHFRSSYYPSAYQPVSALDPLSQELYQQIALEPDYTGPLRQRMITSFGCTKSQFDTGLKRLQISLNIVRSNDLVHKNDFWLTMREVHIDIVES